MKILNFSEMTEGAVRPLHRVNCGGFRHFLVGLVLHQDDEILPLCAQAVHFFQIREGHVKR